MKVVGLFGEPGTGKTTLMKSAMAGSVWNRSKFGQVKYLKNNKGVIILGDYFTNEVFEGTDVLSYTAVDWIQRFLLRSEASIKVLAFEGDRLANAPFLEWLKTRYACQFYLIKALPEELTKRHLERRDGQNEVWLKGRRTKVENLALKFDFEELKNNDDADFKRAAAQLSSNFA